MLVSESDIAVDDRFGRESGRIYLTGLAALARLLVGSRRAGLRANFNTAGFTSSYEGSPLAGWSSPRHPSKAPSAAVIGAMRREREQASIQRFPRKPDDE